MVTVEAKRVKKSICDLIKNDNRILFCFVFFFNCIYVSFCELVFNFRKLVFLFYDAQK